MGFFDKLFKSKEAPPARSPAQTAPTVPCAARIESYDASDGVGVLKLDDGARLRFGRSCCKGFEPVVAARVNVIEIALHPLGGLRAKRVLLDPEDMDYDARLAARDASLGRQPPPFDEVVSSCRALAWITILFDQDLPVGPQALRRWLAEFKLDASGIEAITEAGLRFKVGSQIVTAYVGHGPFPHESLDLRQVGDRHSTGSAFIGLNIGEPGLLRASRSMVHYPDMWGSSGAMRALSRLVIALLERGSSVILNRAAGLVLDGEAFIRMLGDLSDPECRPFGAWIDTALVKDSNAYSTFGMDAFGWSVRIESLAKARSFASRSVCESVPGPFERSKATPSSMPSRPKTGCSS
jgi:hypothetical protein